MRAGCMEFYRIGNSGIFATEAQNKLLRFGIPSPAAIGVPGGMAVSVLEGGGSCRPMSANSPGLIERLERLERTKRTLRDKRIRRFEA